MSLLPRIFATGKHVLTRSPLQMSLSNAAALLDAYKPYSNSLVWHAVENNRQEDAFVEAAAKVAVLGRVTSVCFKCGTDTALKHKFSTAPYDIKRKPPRGRCLVFTLAVGERTGDGILTAAGGVFCEQ